MGPTRRRYDLRWGRPERVDVGGVGIHVESAGPEGARPPLALLHGFGSGTFTWAGVAAHLTDHRLVAWDRPPFGRSDRPDPAGPEDPYGPEAELARAARLVERAGAGAAVVLVGHSAGSLLAVQVALSGRVPVAGLVLVSPALEDGPPPTVRAVSRLPGSALLGASLVRVGAMGAATYLRRTTRHPTPLTEATAAEAGRCLRLPGTAAALWHLTSSWQPPGVLERLGEVDVPAVVVGGVDDRIVSAPAHRTVAEGLGADLRLLEGAGHAPHEQRPDEVAGIIRGFVAALGGR